MKWITILVLLMTTLWGDTAYEEAKVRAKAEEKLVWVFVESPQCSWCRRMKKEIIESGFYERKLSEFYVLVQLNNHKAKNDGFRVTYLPTSFLMNPNQDKAVDILPGYMKPRDFYEFLIEVHRQEQGALTDKTQSK